MIAALEENTETVTVPEMTAQTIPMTLFEQAARRQLQAVTAQSPDWLNDIRLQAFSRYEALGMPTRRQEAWKYINLRPLSDKALLPSEVQDPLVCPPALQRHLMHSEDGQVARLVFVNGRFSGNLSAFECLPDGLILTSMKAACETHAELVQTHLNVLREQEPDAIAALNLSLFEDGAFVYLPDNAQLAPLVQLVFVNVGQDAHAAHPRNLIVLGKQARASLVIEHIGLSDAYSFDTSVNEFVLDEGAQADCTVILSEGPQGWHLAATRNVLQANAKLSLATVTLGGDVNRHTVNTLIKGEHAEAVLYGLDVLQGSTEIYHHTVTEHWVPNAKSDHIYKSILDDRTRSEFNSMVFVAKGADGTDSHQLNRNLLLSEDAHVWTRPQLQINADDVKCAHGATVGQLEKDQLFYLASRGLDPALAESLLTYGFAEDIIQKIPHPRVRQYLDGRVLGNLHRTDATFKQQLGA
jgi:Fe-S cluster assembly protein SufD